MKTDPVHFFRELSDARITISSTPWMELEMQLRECAAGKTVAFFTGQHGPGARNRGEFVEQAASRAECTAFRFDGVVEPEPSTATVERMIEFLRVRNPAAVVAIGGGSVMDAAKAATLAWQSGMQLKELFGSDCASRRFPELAPMRVICMPTTAGTGSEATPYANIVDRDAGVKKLISEKLLVPERAILAPEFTESMPEHVTRATGCDALAHALEGFLNIGADHKMPRANIWAKEAMRLILAALPAVLKAPADRSARHDMAIAAALGGMVIRFKSTGLPHLCSFSWFGRIEHGIAAAMLLPASWSYYLGDPRVAARTMELAELFPGETPREVVHSYRKFLDAIGVPGALSAFAGLTPELLEKTALDAGENKMKLELAPRPVPLEKSAEILGAILRQAYLGEF